MLRPHQDPTIAGLGPGGGPPLEEEQPPEVQEAAPQEWAGPSQEEWEQTQALLAQQQQQLGQYEQVFNPQPMLPGQQQAQFDPFSEDPTTQMRQIIREEMAPFADYAQQFELSQTEEQARDIISALASERGHELQDGIGDLIIAQSAAYAPAVAQQYGSGPQALEAAISAAYDDVYGALASYAEAQSRQNQNELSTLAGAPRELSTTGGPAVQQLVTPPGNEMSVAEKYKAMIYGQNTSSP